MELSYLREFVEFSRYMSVSTAAKQLHIAQPTLSNHIAAMEKEFGCTLIARGKNPRLTSAGRELVNHASEILGMYDHMREVLIDAQARERTITVGMEQNSNCSSMNFTRIATGFIAANHDIYMQMEQSCLPTAREILEEGADCVVTCMCPLESDVRAGLEFRKLRDFFPHKLHLWVHSSNPLAAKSSLRWSDLDGKYPMSTQNPLWAAGCIQTLENHGVTIDVRSNAQENINNLLAVREDEVVLLDEHTAISVFIASIPDHVLVPIDEPDAYCYSYLAYQPDKISPSLQALLDYLDAVDA